MYQKVPPSTDNDEGLTQRLVDNRTATTQKTGVDGKHTNTAQFERKEKKKCGGGDEKERAQSESIKAASTGERSGKQRPVTTTNLRRRRAHTNVSKDNTRTNCAFLRRDGRKTSPFKSGRTKKSAGNRSPRSATRSNSRYRTSPLYAAPH